MQREEQRRDQREDLAEPEREVLQREHRQPTVANAAPDPDPRGDRVCSRIAAPHIGVSTTYMPVMNPEMVAGVCVQPDVCTSWATP